jgi:hypothetical protein
MMNRKEREVAAGFVRRTESSAERVVAVAVRLIAGRHIREGKADDHGADGGERLESPLNLHPMWHLFLVQKSGVVAVAKNLTPTSLLLALELIG